MLNNLITSNQCVCMCVEENQVRKYGAIELILYFYCNPTNLSIHVLRLYLYFKDVTGTTCIIRHSSFYDCYVL